MKERILRFALQRIAASGGGRMHAGVVNAKHPNGQDKCAFSHRCAICIARSALIRAKVRRSDRETRSE